MRPIKISQRLFDEMLICTTRYYIGRQTIATCIWADYLLDKWDGFSDYAKAVIADSLESEYGRYERGVKWVFGDERIDKPHWDKLRDKIKSSDKLTTK